VLAAHLETEHPPPPIARDVWLALRETLDKDPARRPGSAGDAVRRLREGAALAERARWRTTEAPRRVGLAALLAAALFGLGFVLPWPAVPALERQIGDLRVRTSPAKAPDPRILLVTLEGSLESESLANRGDEIGQGLSEMLAAGARGVAIDFLLPAQWSSSQRFSDLLLRHSDALTLAAFSRPDGSVVGLECIDGLAAVALGPQRASEVFGFVNLDEDRDGVVRRARSWFRDQSGARRPSWAGRAARGLRDEADSARELWIDTRIDWTRYARISWREVPAVLAQNPGLFRDALVLLGGDFRASGDDYHRMPHRSGKSPAVSGLTLQALTVDTIGAGFPVREPERLPVLAAAALAAALAAAGALCRRRIASTAVWLAVGASVYFALTLPVFWRTGLIMPITTPLLLVFFGFLAAFVLRRNLAAIPEVSGV
jgi:CHASE2 domain-containing sensor protein